MITSLYNWQKKQFMSNTAVAQLSVLSVYASMCVAGVGRGEYVDKCMWVQDCTCIACACMGIFVYNCMCACIILLIIYCFDSDNIVYMYVVKYK